MTKAKKPATGNNTRPLEVIGADLRKLRNIFDSGELLAEANQQCRHGEWLPWLTRLTTIYEIMSDPGFELGAADARAGKPFRSDYDLWPDTNHRWAYERGRLWAAVTPRNVRLKRDGEVTEAAHLWYWRRRDDII